MAVDQLILGKRIVILRGDGGRHFRNIDAFEHGRLVPRNDPCQIDIVDASNLSHEVTRLLERDQARSHGLAVYAGAVLDVFGLGNQFQRGRELSLGQINGAPFGKLKTMSHTVIGAADVGDQTGGALERPIRRPLCSPAAPEAG